MTQTSTPFGPALHKSARRGFLVIDIDNGLKRLFDIVTSLLGLIILAPLFLFISILIWHDSPGPIFFQGLRSGRNGKPFPILKFRTMYERPESYQGAKVTALDDDRVTPVGRWLRKTKLNELPQLWNVLVGKMSLVGPRPEDPEIVASWPLEVREEILSVRPGISSPASVLYRNEESLLSTGNVMSTYLDSILPSKLRLDQLYVRHRSFWLDLDILLWTFLVLLPKVGGINPPEENLFLGPVSRLIKRYLSWFVIDMLVTFTAVGITGVFWRSLGPLNIGRPLVYIIALGFSFLFSMMGIAVGINRVEWSKTGLAEALDLLPMTFIAMGAALLMNWLWWPGWDLPPAFIIMASALAFIGFVVVRFRTRLLQALVMRWLTLRGGAIGARERVLIVGGGESGQFMSWLLHNGSSASAFHAIGFVDDDLYKQGARIQGLKVLGRRRDIPDLVLRHDVGIIVFAIHNIDVEEREEFIRICSSTNAKLLVIPDILGVLNSTSRIHREDDLGHSAGTHFKPFTGFDGPCQYCLSWLSPSQVNRWLTELQEFANGEDLSSIQKQIERMREEILIYGVWDNTQVDQPSNGRNSSGQIKSASHFVGQTDHSR